MWRSLPIERTTTRQSQSNTNLDVRAMATAQVLRVASDAVLHPQRGVARPHRMILVRDRAPEEAMTPSPMT